MSHIDVVREAGVRFRAEIRGHHLTFDQPVDAGGDDLGPTPTEVFVASLAGCVAYYIERFLERHAQPADGLRVRADFVMAAHPARVRSVDLTVMLPTGLLENLRTPLLAVAEHCTVHNSIRLAPEVHIELEGAQESPQAEQSMTAGQR